MKADSVDAAEEMKQEVEEDITAQDLGDIEKAIEDQARHYRGEIAEVVEDLDEYKEVTVGLVYKTSLSHLSLG